MAIRMSSEPGINAFRFVLMFAVVLAHAWSFSGSMMPRGPSLYLLITAQSSVPAFFITSGYFMRWREGDALSVARWACGKLLPLYFVWIAIYLAVAWFAEMGSFPELATSIFRGGPVRHLWFLVALALALSATSLSLRLLGPRRTWVAAILLAAVGLLNGTYQMWFGMDAHPVRSGVLTAPLLVLIGTKLATTDVPRMPFLFGAATLLAYVAQVYDDRLVASFSGYSTYNRWSMTLATIPFAISVFLFARSLPHTRLLKSVAQYKHFLLVIYCVHPMIIMMIGWVWQRPGIGPVLIATTVAYALSLLCAIILAAAYRRWHVFARARLKPAVAAATSGPAAASQGVTP